MYGELQLQKNKCKVKPPVITEINSMLRKINTEKIWINPDSGLKTRGDEETNLSLKSLVEATKKVRDSLR